MLGSHKRRSPKQSYLASTAPEENLTKTTATATAATTTTTTTTTKET
jgi:hypothetical protein